MLFHNALHCNDVIVKLGFAIIPHYDIEVLPQIHDNTLLHCYIPLLHVFLCSIRLILEDDTGSTLHKSVGYAVTIDTSEWSRGDSADYSSTSGHP